MSEFVGAIDQGTTSSRFAVIDRSGSIVAMAQQEHEQIYPQPGWVEHNADEIWDNTQAVIAEGLGQAGITPSSLAAVGITNQRETAVLWDRATGGAVAPAIVWQDTRTASLVRDHSTPSSKLRFIPRSPRARCGPKPRRPAGPWRSPRPRPAHGPRIPHRGGSS